MYTISSKDVQSKVVTLTDFLHNALEEYDWEVLGEKDDNALYRLLGFKSFDKCLNFMGIKICNFSWGAPFGQSFPCRTLHRIPTREIKIGSIQGLAEKLN